MSSCLIGKRGRHGESHRSCYDIKKRAAHSFVFYIHKKKVYLNLQDFNGRRSDMLDGSVGYYLKILFKSFCSKFDFAQLIANDTESSRQLSSEQHCVKSARFRSYSDPHFPAFGLNTERYGVFRRTRITLNTNTFYAVQEMLFYWKFL